MTGWLPTGPGSGDISGHGVDLVFDFAAVLSIFLAKTFCPILCKAETTLAHDASQSLSNHAFIVYITRSSMEYSRSMSFSSVSCTDSSRWMAIRFTSLQLSSFNAVTREEC